MKNLKGTRTEVNLKTAFAGESQARNKYTYFASVARKEGYEHVAAAFEDSAGNEREHAKVLLRFLGGIGDTAANLEAAAGGENQEWTEMYPGFEKIAREEGFPEIAEVLKAIAVAEAAHEARFRTIREALAKGTLFAKGESREWRCRNCGYVHKGPGAPETCPACGHPKAFFELRCGCF
jgi:rubrerythrin